MPSVWMQKLVEEHETAAKGNFESAESPRVQVAVVPETVATFA